MYKDISKKTASAIQYNTSVASLGGKIKVSSQKNSKTRNSRKSSLQNHVDNDNDVPQVLRKGHTRSVSDLNGDL